jgi:LysM repeat protein
MSDERAQAEKPDRLADLWEGLSRAGLADLTMRLGTHALLVAFILLVSWGMRELYWRAGNAAAASAGLTGAGGAAAAPKSGETAPTAEPTPAAPLQTPIFSFPSSSYLGVLRQAEVHTDLPAPPRSEITTYTVQPGDTIWGIAEKHGLQPETILWGNYFTLRDNPHELRPGQELNILPVDGVYHRWSAGDGLNGVARYFGVKPEDIINYPGNNLTMESVGDWSNPNIEPGTFLVVPDGKREFISWSAPEITRSDPKKSGSVLGPGACSGAVDGAIGSGAFVWPANNHFLSGFDWNPGANHRGIDIAGKMGEPTFSIDHGVVVYSGWNNWGYGNVVVINHGNGWQSLYAHLSEYYVSCGQSVFQGATIGAIGSTGNSTGAHLHFEVMYKGVKVNPWDYLP